MSWKFARSMSITSRLVLIFMCSTLLILSVITGLVYPPMRELLYQSHLNNEHYTYLLTQICIKKFFIGLWVSTFIIILASYVLAKKSMKPIKNFSKELAKISVSSLDKRVQNNGNPRELQDLARTCNELLFRIEHGVNHIKQFSASMAHELRNPIHYLRTATEITLAKPQTIETYQQLLHTHLEEYQNLSQLIDNLLFLTRCEQGQLQLQKKPCAARGLIQSILEYYVFIAQDKGINIEVEGDAEIDVDEQLFKRVIANLLDNCLTYTHQDGEIRIHIATLGEGVEIRVQDSGIGIAKEHLPFLCQGFYRVDYETKSNNSGLGLAIARSIIDLHRGQLVVESQLDLGTSVILTLF